MEARARGLSFAAGARYLASRPRLASIALTVWIGALVIQYSGGGSLHHGTAAGAPVLSLFILVWTAHIVVMMLPSALPMVAVFGRAAERDDEPALAQAAFISGYLVVWGAFGVTAVVGDGVLHRMVEAVPVLERPGLIPGLLLIGAGAFQFSELKDRCLTECRHPGAFLLRHYRRGPKAALRLGVHHGLHCLGCCWALMLVVFALGAAHPVIMIPAAAVMYAERVTAFGRRLVRPLGVLAVALGAPLVASGLGIIPL